MRILVLLVLIGSLAVVNRVEAADIVWASLVSDTDPAMPDQGFLDLLTGAGHTVTRFEVEGANSPLPSSDVDLLNMADLIILGRGNSSGNFQDGDSIPWNEQVTAPVLLMSAYLSRQNRLGWQAGNSVPDSGPTPLVANDPNHPIFAGITFQADGMTMDEDYNVMIDRGTTTIGDPLVPGGIVIATNPSVADGNGVAIAEWPMGVTVTPDNAPPAQLAGPRYFFAGGSREADGSSVQDTAGVMDLTTAGQTLFLNTVNYILDVEPPVPGDFNGDGMVNEQDFEILSNNLGAGIFDDPVGRSEGDMNFDGRVDLDDFGQFKELFPAAFAQAQAVPEPSTLALVGAVLALLGVCRLSKSGRRG